MAARVMVMAGGTGGHVFPALAVAQELRERGWEVSWLGTPDSFESRVVPEYGFAIDWVDAYRLRGAGVTGLLLAPFRLMKAMHQAWRVMRSRRPQVVLGMGGFVTAPGGVVSRLMRVPLVIHEQNAIPGLTNRLLSRIANRVLEAFPGSFEKDVNATATGNPVRQGIASVEKPDVRMAEHKGSCRLLVVGGSLGAQALNETVPKAVALLPDEQRPEIFHQAGRGKLESAERAYGESGVDARVAEFMDDMAEAYGWADLVICRAGALTVTELAAAGMAAIMVPYPHAVDDHQTHNARFLTAQSAGLLIQQSELSAESLAETLKELCSDRTRMIDMAKAARALAKPDSAAVVADICEMVRAA